MKQLKFSITFVFVVVMIRFESAEGEKYLKHMQNAVVPLVGWENFYVQMRKEIPVTYVDDGQLGHLRDYDYSNENNINYAKYKHLEPPCTLQIPTERGQSLDLKAKSLICSFILESPFFKARGEVAVSYDLTETETMNKLRESNRDAYDDIYGNFPDAQGQWLNPYKRRIVSVGGERFEEHTFRCLARRRDPETTAADSFVHYFVSPIYQLKRPRELLMDGRFVFTSNDDQELILVATAEERLSKSMGFSYILDVHQYYYVEKKKGYEYRKPEKESNELCTLPLRDKIRLCDSAINLPDFPDKVTFVPSKANVKQECEEIKVSGKADKYYNTHSLFKTARTVEITYDQWMVGCKVDSTGDDLPASSSWYYISVGLSRRTVMVFKESAAKNVYVGCTFVDSVRWVDKASIPLPISYKVVSKSSVSTDILSFAN